MKKVQKNSCSWCLCQTSGSDAELCNQAEACAHGEMLGPNSEANDGPGASGEAPGLGADQGNEEQQQQEQQEAPARQRQAENEVSEVEIPNVGRIMVRADADGYNEEVRKLQC